MMDQDSDKEIPSYNSVEWHDYVMSHFTPEELIDGHPKTNSLRRVAGLILGDIISSKPVNVWPVEGNGVGRATVVWEVVFKWKLDGEKAYRTFGDVCDTWEGNTDDLFLAHAVATAGTKAEGRALRKALNIRALAAEELCKKDVRKFIADQITTEERITSEQKNLINVKCKKLDIDVIKFINSGKKNYRSIHEVSKETAKAMIKNLNEYSVENVPENIKGYQEDWSK
jgi:hypothetical protein